MSAPAPSNSENPVDGVLRGRADGNAVWGTVVGFAFTRLLGNLFVRAPYVFINQISKGLGVSVDTMTFALGFRELGGLAAPLAGRWVDRGHGVRVIAFGGVLAGVSCVAASTSWFWLFVVVMIVGGMAKNWIDLAQNAWVGHRVPVSKRARVIGLIETTWAGSFLIGIPVLGWSVNQWGWRAAFIVTGPLLSLVAIGSAARLRGSVGLHVDPQHDVEPHVAPHSEPALVEVQHRGLEALGNPARLKRAIWAFCILQPFGQMMVFAVNGDWFVEQLGMTTGGLATATAMLGVAELLGTFVVMGFADRLGPIRVATAALCIAVVPLVALAMTEPSLWWGVGLLLVMDFGVEIAFVSVLPVVSELDVANRGKAVGQVLVLVMVSRAVSSAVAGIVYTTVGFEAAVAAAAMATALGAAALAWAQLGNHDGTMRTAA